MAVFDVLFTNPDSKGNHLLAHLLAMGDGHLVRSGAMWADLHSESNSRTLLWGWVGDEVDTEDSGASIE